MNISMITGIVLLLVWTPLLADETIGRCVDEEGVITFTDIYCYSTRQIQPLRISKSYKIYQSLPGRDSPAIPETNMDQLEASLQQTLTACREGFSRYLSRKRLHADTKPEIEFNEVIDQYYRKKAQSITVRGKAQFTVNGTAQESVVECTLQNLQHADR